MVPPLCHRALGHLGHSLVIAAPPLLLFRIPDMGDCTGGNQDCQGSKLRHIISPVARATIFARMFAQKPATCPIRTKPWYSGSQSCCVMSCSMNALLSGGQGRKVYRSDRGLHLGPCGSGWTSAHTEHPHRSQIAEAALQPWPRCSPYPVSGVSTACQSPSPWSASAGRWESMSPELDLSLRLIQASPLQPYSQHKVCLPQRTQHEMPHYVHLGRHEQDKRELELPASDNAIVRKCLFLPHYPGKNHWDEHVQWTVSEVSSAAP